MIYPVSLRTLFLSSACLRSSLALPLRCLFFRHPPCVASHAFGRGSRRSSFASRRLPRDAAYLCIPRWRPAPYSLGTCAGQLSGRGAAHCSARCFHHFSEKAARILWCLNSQLLLEATIPADLVHQSQVSPRISAQKLSCLSAYPCRVSTWQEHYDLHDTPHIDNGRFPLPSARKTEVYPIWINLGVALFDAL